MESSLAWRGTSYVLKERPGSQLEEPSPGFPFDITHTPLAFKMGDEKWF
jgi:hypothetical protein